MVSKVLALLLLAAGVVFATTQSPLPSQLLLTTGPPPPTPAPDVELEKKDPPPHILVKPKTWKLGTTETLSLMIYNTTHHSRSIQTILFKRQCKCVTSWWSSRRCKVPVVEYKIFSHAQLQVTPGQAALFHIKLPSHDGLTNNEFFLTVRSTLGEMFVDKQLINFNSNSRGMIVVRTDKPIYKPSQTIKFCVITLDATARPRPAEVSVRIQDPHSRKIEEWKSVEISDDGYECLELELSDEPPLGTWRISITEIVERGLCASFYGSLSGSCDFKVDTFVLPRFEVKVTAPEYIRKKTKNIKGSVSAVYVFGEPVEGTVKIKFTLEAKTRGESFDFHTTTDRLENGKVDFSVPAAEYMRILRYRFDPFCVSSAIKIFAEVEEKGRGTKFNDTASVPLVANRFSFSFDDKMPRMFRAGMDYPVMIKSLRPDDSPARFKQFYLTITANNGVLSIWTKKRALNTNKRGEWMKNFKIPRGANCLKILVRPVPNKSCENINICLTPVAVFSPSSTYLQLTASNMEPKISDTLKLTATSNRNFEHVQCMVIARGQLLSHHSVASTGSSAAVEVVVSAHHTPRFQVVCFFAQKNRELVGDMMEIETECNLEHKVAMTFHHNNNMAIIDEENSVAPMTKVYVNVTSTPNTPVLVSLFDKSLSLLADKCDSGKKSSVCKRLDSIASGTIASIDHSCSAASSSQCCYANCQERQRVDINKIIRSLGIDIKTNVYLPSAPIVTRPRPTLTPRRRPTWFRRYRYDTIAGLSTYAITTPGAMLTTVSSELEATPTISDLRVKDASEDVSEMDELEEGGVRKLFPESWLFQVIETGSDGHGKLPSTAPDTITTWVGQGVALSKEEGIGFSDLASIKVFKSFFVSLELPFSVNFGETVIIKPVVFNFLKNSVLVTISINLHDDLSLLNQAPGPLPIQTESSNSFELRVLPRAIGRLPIRITAQIFGMNIRDVVEKLLYVKFGCVRYEKINTLLAKDDGQTIFDILELPTCTIPGSQKASITITGDLMSPPNLDNLLVVPSGCGEQNLVKTTNNFVVANYLDATEQLTEAIAIRVRANIMKGYQKELNFQLVSGAFAMWPKGWPSVWLTAFALSSFSEIAHLYGNRSFVDDGVMNTAFSYLMRKQNENGCFELEGAVHNYRLLNGNAPITAFVLIALKSYEMVTRNNSGLEHSIDQATRCLVNYTRSNSDGICTYTLALSSYALAQQGENENTTNVITQLKGDIRPSTDYPGTCYVCNSCTVRGNGQMGQQCEGESPRRDPITSDCVETTAYTLLALLEVRDIDRIGCLAQWLIKQQNSFGSFGSSQDTIVGLKALAAFSRHTFTREINMMFEVETGSHSERILIDNENRYIRHEVMVPSITSSTVMSWSGEGTALVQSVLSYHGCDCCNSSDCFQFSAKSVAAPLDSITMETCFSYQCGNKSNMAILDVQIPSGCVFEKQTRIRGDVIIHRIDVAGDSVVLYLDELTSKTTCLKLQCDKKFEIKNRKPVAFTIYDYYMPTERVTVFIDELE